MNILMIQNPNLVPASGPWVRLSRVASVAWVSVASVARVVGWVEARSDSGFGHGPSRAETHHLGTGIIATD